MHELVRLGDFVGSSFELDRPITRGEMARILARGLAAQPLPHGVETPEVNDLPPGALGDDILAAVQRGLIRGYPDGTFRHDQTAQRAEAAVMLLRTMRATEQQGPHAFGAFGAEVAFPVHQFIHAAMYGYADAPDGGVSDMSQWATPVAVDAFQQLLQELGDGTTRFVASYLNDQYTPSWVGRGASVASVDVTFYRQRHDTWEVRRVGFNFYLRFQNNRWEIVGMGIAPNYGDPEWADIGRDVAHVLLFRVEDPLIGGVYTLSRPDQIFDGEAVRRHLEAYANLSKAEILNIDGVPWERSQSANLVHPFATQTYASPPAEMVMYMYDASLDRLTARGLTQDELAGLLWNAFHYIGQSLPLAIDGVPWSEIWREPLLVRLANMPRDQVTAELNNLSAQVYELLQKRR